MLPKYHPETGALSGPHVSVISRSIGDLRGVFADEQARVDLPQEQLAYRVKCHTPVAEGTSGGLFFGTSYLEPGLIGDEYMMTKGHFHAVRDTAEYYWCISGSGYLLLMDEKRKSWIETIQTGSLHYIPGSIAHRLINTGDQTLIVSACWPADAGHDYSSIVETGFSSRVRCVGGKPQICPE